MPALAREAWTFDAIGTTWSVEARDGFTEAARADVAAAIDGFDRAWSRFRGDSTVAALASGGDAPAPPDAEAMLSLYARLDDATDGAVNPLVGEALARLGYDAAYTLAPSSPRSAPRRWRELLTWHAGRLRLHEPATIDVGALGKGRLVDRVLEVLARHGVTDVVVDASGDMAVRGRTERVGLEHPYRPGAAIGIVEVTDAALCASAVTRRAWGDGLHHVLDARSGTPVRAYAATWAIAPTAMVADALATALFFDGGPALAADVGVEWVRMRTDGAVEWSPGSKAELFT
ncbi:FAD:protein FMN transferase [Microbacterium sp. 10M-3C3]|uniref:FAD:protein FMN transferase n=1 Tax=Microbacterium sp. 10M-3C3 TaxID=2483401 RepID=UPI000F631CBE|nr:FAD:protein FMN transferase [Microbacterium sp. 10M-3C3]